MSEIKNKWVIVYERYEGLEAKAIDRLCGALYAQTGYVIPAFAAESLDETLLAGNHALFVGKASHRYLSRFLADGVLDVPEGEQGYSMRVCDSIFAQEYDMVMICGVDDAGVLYGAVDFYNLYMGTEVLHHGLAERTQNKYYEYPFVKRIPPYARKSHPAIQRRGIWTWGHCIYDYKKFFENMVLCKLNQVVIWNDYAPLNARAVVDYAHSLGIALHWGFSWGWDTRFQNFEQGESIDDDALIDRWATRVYEQYTREYAPTGADGIYFQSFTELAKDTLGGVRISTAVVKWVNRISAHLFETYPTLDIQFGLHASSVRDHLEDIAEVDERVHIIWEDCGAFPYNYSPEAVDGFQHTVDFNERICTLRGEKERFGAILKGMTKLDWSSFEHQSGPYVMGECPQRYLPERAEFKRKVWQNLQSYWIENAEFASVMIREIARVTGGATNVQMLVEDGCFEEGIYFPVALCSEMLWGSKQSVSARIGRVLRAPMTKLASH